MRVRGGDCRCGFLVKGGSKELVIGLRRGGAKEAAGGSGDPEQPSSRGLCIGGPRWAQDTRVCSERRLFSILQTEGKQDASKQESDMGFMWLLFTGEDWGAQRGREASKKAIARVWVSEDGGR